jgi:hypothetical protein
MKTVHWIALTTAALVLSFTAGYRISASTGVQPGYFDAVEAGGYGGEETTVEGISKEQQDYYKNLYKEDKE